MRWVEINLQATGSETWACTRCLNNRGTLTVLLVGANRHRRYRTDQRTKTSVRELLLEGWKLNHRYPGAGPRPNSSESVV